MSILDLESRGIVLSLQRKQRREAELCFCFLRHMQNVDFLMMRLNYIIKGQPACSMKLHYISFQMIIIYHLENDFNN